MGAGYPEFFGFFFLLFIACGLVALSMLYGIRKDFALKYDCFYLWHTYADSEDELLEKIRKLPPQG